MVVITTGSQGEPMSGLARMAFAEHRKLEIRDTDMVIISATPIPGNEKSVSRVINQLLPHRRERDLRGAGRGARLRPRLPGGAQADPRAGASPQFFIPVHGEYRHLYHHANLAKAHGHGPRTTCSSREIGEVIELTGSDAWTWRARCPAAQVLIDGLGIGDVGSVVLRDRKHLAQDGLLIVVMAVDHDSGAVVSGPDIISRGFVYVREADDLVEGARAAASSRAQGLPATIDSAATGTRVKSDVREARAALHLRPPSSAAR